jgi:hypothetical protein
MERLQQKLFTLWKKRVKSTTSRKINRLVFYVYLFQIDSQGKNDDDEIYLEPNYDETSNITTHVDSIAEELLAIAKKSVRRLAYLI